MKHVELVPRHLLERALDDLLAEEVTRVVQMNAAPLELGPIADFKAGIAGAAPGVLGRRDVQERTARIEGAGCVGVPHRDALGCHRKLVPFGGDVGLAFVTDGANGAQPALHFELLRRRDDVQG